MKEYIDKVGQSIPNTLQLARSKEVIRDTYGLILYGYYEDVGFKSFFKKIKQGIKAKSNG
jgi:hypothetical protein